MHGVGNDPTYNAKSCFKTFPFPAGLTPLDTARTKLYNQRPAWLSLAHQQLDAAVATAYGWTDYSAAMPDEEILKRLLALNLERSDASKLQDTKK